jgi:hypothetical protein
VAVERQSDHAPDMHLFRHFLDAPAVNPHMAFVDYALRQRAALHQPNEEEEAVDPHFFLSLASSAKA